jgi:Zn finger protein HypA/HybF involved in hydrogenase expression
MPVTALNRTLDQEVLALEREASLECLVCGEFVLRTPRGLRCPECGSALSARGRAAETQLQFSLQAG